MNRQLRAKLAMSPELLKPAVVDAHGHLIARQQQQKKFYNRTAKPLLSLQEGQVVCVNHNGESQRAIVHAHAGTPHYIQTEDGSTLRRNRAHLRSTAEDKPIITPSLIEDCEQSLMAPQDVQPSPAPILHRSSRAKTLPVRLTDYVLTRTC